MSATVKFGTVLSPGQSAVYPSSLYTPLPISTSSSQGLSKGAIAGIAVGSAAGFILIAIAVSCLVMYRWKRSKRSKRDSTTQLIAAQNRQTRPEMSQSYHTNPNLTLPPPAMAAGNGQSYDSAQRQPFFAYIKRGLRNGEVYDSGHRRVDSAASTTPFLPDAGYPAPGGNSPRFSTNSSFNTNNPAMYSQNRFSSASYSSPGTLYSGTSPPSGQNSARPSTEMHTEGQ